MIVNQANNKAFIEIKLWLTGKSTEYNVYTLWLYETVWAVAYKAIKV